MRILFKTKRLELIALEDELARVALRDREKFARILGAQVPEEWPLTDMREALPLFGSFSEGEAFGGVLVLREGRAVVGDAGFHATPVEAGDAEIGYSLVPRHRGKGYATEAVHALLAMGWRAGLCTVMARVERENVESHRVLVRTGFHRDGESDGYTVWRVERPVTSA